MPALSTASIQSADLPDPDARLVLEAQKNPNAFQALYDRWAVPVYQYFYYRTGDVACAEDLTSQLFLSVYQSLSRYIHRGHFAAWLFAIARNLLARHYRRQRDPQPAQLWYEPESDAKDDRLAAVREAIQRLPAELRDTLELRLEQELSYEEIAHVLDIPIGTVRSRLHNAVRQLRDAMKNQEERTP
jgi:RNA polymerase sigma-70 factor (ECF subfamily)